jgi:YVTN family beta-propeller protein
MDSKIGNELSRRDRESATARRGRVGRTGPFTPWLLAAMLWTAAVSTSPAASDEEKAGPAGAGRAVTPVNQILTPYGLQVDLPGLRPQALALSPNGKLLVTSGKANLLIVVDPVTGKIIQQVPLPSDKIHEPQPETVSPQILQPDKEGQLSFTGLIFSPDGSRIYLSNVNGSIKVFGVAADGKVTGLYSLALPEANAPRRKAEIPSGLAMSTDGKRLYVVFNLSNQVAELNAITGQVLRLWPVGVAPYDVLLEGNKLYVSNWGGRRPLKGELTGPAGRGTKVKVDPVRFIAKEGSVSVIDLAAGRVVAETLVGMHASGLALAPNHRHLVVANATSDTLSVIDTRTDRIVETIWMKQNPGDLFGASPNALAFDAAGKTLYVANGTQNAVAVVSFKPGASKLQGLIPAGWFPGALVFDAPRNQLCVANIKGLGPGRHRKSNAKPEFNSHQYYGSLILMPIPKARELPQLSAQVWQDYRRERIALAKLPPRPGEPARPVPERIGEPSVFKHVVYIIKENRTYDQVLGDVTPGNGDPELCIFGEKITPNQHKMVKDFALLDNTYCAGICSADGHQWSTTAFGTDYLERSFAGWPRSYPDGMGEDENDALAYAPSGFIWDNAAAHHVSQRDYGEFAAPAVKWRDHKRKGTPDWTACYRTWKGETNEVIFASYPMVASLRPIMPTNYVGWAMEVPDQYRADFFIRELKQMEANNSFPGLVIICLPDDHTSGTSKGSPTPGACVADNDLAFGRIVEAISHSKFWPETAIFAIEDDPQAGWDHVCGYRTSAYCVSPYTKRHAVVSTQYNTTSILRTMEQILGMPPMNQFDATATPMFDCFTETPDYTPFDAVASNIALNEMNPEPKTIRDSLLRKHALASARLPLKKPDQCPEDLLNRILWHAMKGSAAPYPEWAVMRGVGDDD